MEHNNDENSGKIYLKFLDKYLEPDAKFIEETRGIFLIRIQQKNKFSFLVAPFRVFQIPAWKYGLSFALVFVFLTSGIAIYADSNYVSANHPLYGVKRLGENIRVAISSSQARVILQERFARRRADEMKIVKNAKFNPEKIIKELEADYENRMNFVIERMPELHYSKEQGQKFCGHMAETIKIQKAISDAIMVENNFKDKCGQFAEEFAPVK